jgi:hypothetical protein
MNTKINGISDLSPSKRVFLDKVKQAKKIHFYDYKRHFDIYKTSQCTKEYEEREPTIIKLS